MMLLLLCACTADKDVAVLPDDTGYAHVDTSVVPDSGDTATTDTTESVPDSDTDTSGDTGPPAPTWVALDVYPGDIVVGPDATFQARAVGTRSDGTRGDADVAWVSDDEDIAAVDAEGLVLALEPGVGRVTATVDGLSASFSFEVDDSYEAEVTVLDAVTGLPIPDARVALPSTNGQRTDATGYARLPVPDGMAIDFSVWVDNTYDAVSFLQVVNRRYTVYLWPIDTAATDATLHGVVDFSGVDDAAWDELVLGLSAPATPVLATMRLDDWFSDERVVTVFGFDTDLPSNLVLEGEAEDYFVRTGAGPSGSWVLAGPLKVSDVSAATGSTGDALRLLIDHLDVMRWGWAGGATTTLNSTTELGLAPASTFDHATVVAVPELPTGFTGAEDVLVMTAEDRDGEGYYITGFALSAGDAVSVPHVDPAGVTDSRGTAVVAYAQAGGLGGTGGTSVASGTVDALGNGTVAAFLDLPVISSWDPATRAMAVTTDGDADFVHVLLTDSHHLRHHLYVGDAWSGTVPNTLADFGRATAVIDVETVATADDTFEARCGRGQLDVRAMPAVAASHTRQE